MFFQQLPAAVRWTLLMGVGAVLGSLVNWAIYRLAIFDKRNVSPWSPAPSAARPRSFADRIPVVGWFRLRREQDVFGKGHWIRPLLIEVGCAVGIAWFYHWMMEGGLYGGTGVRLVPDQVEIVKTWKLAWFLFFSTLFLLMIACTFIDFDEQTIPDWLTVPGTLGGMFVFAMLPAIRLPVRTNDRLMTRLAPIDFWTPDAAVMWHLGWIGLVVALFIVAGWAFALMPKWATNRWGLFQGCKIMLASVVRPTRKTVCKVGRSRPRKMHYPTRVFGLIGIIASVFVVFVFFVMPQENWTSLVDSLLGLAMGGGIVWAVRIIASNALGVEAMGFGDVTLMCMVGACVGWQAALVAFVLAPFTSIAVALVQVVTTGENRMAFGPYLCLGTAIVLMGWDYVWNDWVSLSVFNMGSGVLLGIIAICLVLMAVMLGTWGMIKKGQVSGKQTPD